MCVKFYVTVLQTIEYQSLTEKPLSTHCRIQFSAFILNCKKILWNNYDSTSAEWYEHINFVVHVDCTLFAKNANFNSNIELVFLFSAIQMQICILCREGKKCVQLLKSILHVNSLFLTMMIYSVEQIRNFKATTPMNQIQTKLCCCCSSSRLNSNWKGTQIFSIKSP